MASKGTDYVAAGVDSTSCFRMPQLPANLKPGEKKLLVHSSFIRVSNTCGRAAIAVLQKTPSGKCHIIMQTLIAANSITITSTSCFLIEAPKP